MKAFVLAAGKGERLRPLTDGIPKALVEVGGVPMLEIVLRRLKAAGVREVVINLHHHAGQIEDFLRRKANLGLGIAFSREETLLETGGGLKQAAGLLDGGEPFLIHNADVLSAVDLRALARAHQESGALATLAVRSRPTSRQLLFGGDGRLAGRRRAGGAIEWARGPVGEVDALAFDGIHAASPELLRLLTETGAFPIVAGYLRLAGEGRPIRAFRTDGWAWAEVGSLEKLEAARRLFEERGRASFLGPDASGRPFTAGDSR